MDKVKFAEWLQLEMDQRGWKSADLARAAGVSDATISNVISGARRAGPDLCRGIAKALDEPEERVFRMAGLLSPLRGPEDRVSFRELYEMWRDLSPEDRKMIREFTEYRYKTSRDE